VKALIKEKKEKENVMIDLELVNLKNISLLQFEELKIKIVEAKKRNCWRKKMSIKGICSTYKHN